MRQLNQKSHGNQDGTDKKLSGQTLFFGSSIVLCLVALGYFVFAQNTNGQSRGVSRQSELTLEQIPFDGAAAKQWLDKICEIGPRVSGTPGMQKQQELLVPHFEALGGQVELQKFRVRHPVNGGPVPMANIVVRWHPERKERIMFCAHYDTRPFPDQDPVNKQGVFIGANDGASGVAVLAVLGQYMKDFDSKLGVDFVLFDGEELVYSRNDRYFLGSEWFAREYAGNKERDFKYRAAVLLDMVGDQSLEIYQERNGLRWRDSRWIVETIWKKANELGVREFINQPHSGEILDDHIMLHKHGKIPACDLIDFTYRSPDRRMNYWHTTEDLPDKCSALSLAKVGWVIHEWLKDEGKKRK